MLIHCVAGQRSSKISLDAVESLRFEGCTAEGSTIDPSGGTVAVAGALLSAVIRYDSWLDTM